MTISTSSLDVLNLNVLANIVQYLVQRDIPVNTNMLAVGQTRELDLRRIKETKLSLEEDRFPALVVNREKIMPYGGASTTTTKYEFVTTIDNQKYVFDYRNVEVYYEARYYCSKNVQLEKAIESLILYQRSAQKFAYRLPWMQEDIEAKIEIGVPNDASRIVSLPDSARQNGVVYMLPLSIRCQALLVSKPPVDPAVLIQNTITRIYSQDGGIIYVQFSHTCPD